MISHDVHSSIPIVGVITGVANMLCAIFSLKADCSDETLSLLNVPTYATFISWPRYR